jgi:hypothetical protein
VVFAALEKYRKLSLGPGYVKLAEYRLDLIKFRLNSVNVSQNEKKELFRQKEDIEKTVKICLNSTN